MGTPFCRSWNAFARVPVTFCAIIQDDWKVSGPTLNLSPRREMESALQP